MQNMHLSGLVRRQLPNAVPTPSGPETLPTSPSPSFDNPPDASPSTAPTPSPSPTASASAANNKPAMGTGAIIGIVVVIAVIAGILLSCILLRKLRQRHKNPKYIPTKFLKQRWEAWEPGHTRLPRTTDNWEPLSRNASSQPAASFSENADPAVPRAAAGVDRN
ncbi:hypothetical protein DH86_00002949, partial [Scytalidium sp. 3C]